ncbi:MAG: 16S rRNA (adenine(1518)-N(6)/adenine(1519)-N(6))-dimethyltransferase RsmA [Desulfosoma sp.]
MIGFISPQEYFRLHGGRPRKHLGQHFLTQPKTAEKIVQAATLAPDDVVVEVGPGLGMLTAFLLEACAAVHLVEIDPQLADFLQEAVSGRGGTVRVHRQDILEFDWDGAAREAGRRLVVVGNLPYQISSPLLFRILENRHAIHHGVFMVQREVGRRFAAEPGSGDYGVLSVLLRLYGTVRPVLSVGPGQFYPPPKVDSLVVRVDFPEERSDVEGVDFQWIRQVVNAAFQKRRKTVANSLTGFHGLGAAGVKAVLHAAGIDPTLRPEALGPEAFASLARTLKTTISSSHKAV